VMDVREDEVSKESFAWRRARYLRDLSKQKLKDSW